MDNNIHDVADQLQLLVQALQEREEQRKRGFDTHAFYLGYVLSTVGSAMAMIPAKHRRAVAKYIEDSVKYCKEH